MIKLEHVVLASPEQMEFIIEGMRNLMNSWGTFISLAKTISWMNGENSVSGLKSCHIQS
jgi:hypothetical protein